jgi:hypothetical protein
MWHDEASALRYPYGFRNAACFVPRGMTPEGQHNIVTTSSVPLCGPTGENQILLIFFNIKSTAGARNSQQESYPENT